MKIDLNTVKWFLDFELPPVDELVEKIGAQLGAVDEVIDIGSKYKDVKVVRVVQCKNHPDADKLKVCMIDNGGKELVQVVCGAPNVHEGMLAAWLPPSTTVPNTVGKDPFVLEARELRGEKSNGMLASPKELAFGDDHDGLLEIEGDLKPGDDFAEAFGLKDNFIIDIENKMFTHRPDCFGFMGVARELAGIYQKPFKSPDWYQVDPKFPDIEAEELKLEVKNELPELVPRFTAIAIRDVQVGPSPVWLAAYLARTGQKAINNIVDYTNWYMLETGQPLHAYDYDKVKALSDGDSAAIVIRNPKPGEKLKLLNGKTIEPRPEAVMIATNKQLIGVGGVMGGDATEVDSETKNIILECANFDMYSVRRTSMAHGLFTEAVTRFTKGQSSLQNLAVLDKIVNEIRQHAGGKVTSRAIDDNHLPDLVKTRGSLHPPVKISAAFINDRLGLKLSAGEIKTLLANVEFGVELNDDELTVTAPFWRIDIELREDVVEEVGRLYGYDKLPLVLPQRDLTPTPRDPLLELKAQIRQALSRAGANEVLAYSFVHGDLLDKVGQDKAQAFRLSNALSPDLQYYRLSLTPSLLEKVHPNLKAGYDEFALFEIGKAHVRSEPDPYEPTVPKEVNALAFIYAAKNPKGAPYYWARRQLLNLLAEFHSQNSVTLEPLKGADLYKNPWVEQMTAPFESNRSAVLRDSQGLIWGVVGEFKASVRQALKLPAQTAGFEIDSLLLLRAESTSGYTPLPRFPKVTQDVTLRIAAELSYQELFDFLAGELDKAKPENSLAGLEPIDIYQKEADREHKNVTFRLSIASYERTLTDAEVNKLLDALAAAAKEKFGAERL